MKRLICAALVLCLALTLSACAGRNSQEATQQTDYLLISSGFTAIQANTTQRVEHLRSLPQHHILHLVRNGKDYYLWADAEDCQCLWVGDWNQYQRFKKLGWEMYNQGGQNRLDLMDGWDTGHVDWDMWGPW